MVWVSKVRIRYIGRVLGMPYWVVSSGRFSESFTNPTEAVAFASEVYQDKVELEEFKEILDRW